MPPSTQSHISTGQFLSRDADETFRLGKQVGDQLSGGEILLLDGPLGAGKTVFVKGIAAALKIDPAEVTSPSFTLVNPYSGRLPFFHLDLYRLEEGPAAANAVDLEEILANETAVVAIEWAARLGSYPLHANAWRIVISGDGEEPRTIKLTEETVPT